MFMEHTQRLSGGLGTKGISHRKLGWAREMQLGNIPWIFGVFRVFVTILAESQQPSSE